MVLQESKEALLIIKANYASMTSQEILSVFHSKGIKNYTEEFINYHIVRIRKYFKESNKKRNLESIKTDCVKYRAKTMLSSAKARALAKNMTYDLTYEWLYKKMLNGHCEATGLPFIVKNEITSDRKTKNPFSPSIDRIDSSQGYTMDNCQIVCNHFNYMKNVFSMEQTLDIAKSFVNFQISKQELSQKE